MHGGSDIEVTLEKYIYNFQTLYEVMMDRDDQDLGQWRIKVVMEEMNLPCSSSSVWLLEDGERTHNIQYCNEKKAETVFYSHEHLIDIKFKNKVKGRGVNFQIKF